VTDYLEEARVNPSTDYGMAVIAKDTDGWQMFFNGATDPAVRPRLVIASQQSTALQGDHNGDGINNAADYPAWRKLNPGNETAYNTWRQNFGMTGSSEPPPGPKTVLNYDLNGITAAATPSTPATQAAPGASGLPLSIGPGLAAAGLNNGFSSQNWTNVTADGGTIDRARAIAMGDYIQFGFTLDGSHEASLTSLDLALRRSAANAPMNFEIQASLDGFTTAGTTIDSAFTYRGRVSGNAAEPNPTLTDPFVYMTTDTPGRPNAVTSPSDQIPTVDLSSVGLLQDIAPGTTVTFRLYGWGDGAAGAANTNTIGFRVNGPRVMGFITPTSGASGAVPEPASALMAGIFAALVGLSRRQRR
jgi:hypothetical protein